MRVLSSLKASPLGASHAASRAWTWRASCLEWQKATRSSAYAEARVMPTRLPDALVRAVEWFLLSA
jgi:hypothetical protein